MTLISKRFFLNRSKMINFLIELAATSDGTARSLYLPYGLPPPEVEHSLEKVGNLPVDATAEIIKHATESKTGASLFWGPAAKCLVIPPFPIRQQIMLEGYAVETLISLLKHDFRVALILVRLGSYAVGVYHGENRVSSKVGTGLVHGRHKKGGTSQHRFQRHREKQIESFLERVCLHARERLEPQLKSLDYLVYGGAWTTILSLQKRCPFLRQFDDRTLPPLLDIPDPRQMVLEKAIGRVWSSSIIQWRDSEIA